MSEIGLSNEFRRSSTGFNFGSVSRVSSRVQEHIQTAEQNGKDVDPKSGSRRTMLTASNDRGSLGVSARNKTKFVGG